MSSSVFKAIKKGEKTFFSDGISHKEKWLSLLYFIVPVIALMVIWQCSALALNREELPTVPAVFIDVWHIIQYPEDMLNLWASLARMLSGYALAMLIAIPVGLAMGRSPLLADMLNPLTTIIYPIPKAALMPIIMLWIGIGDFSKILVIFLSVSLPMLYHSYQGALSIDTKILWSARAMGMSAPARLCKVILPASLPEVLLGCRIAITMALITMISSEMVARQNGIGNLLFNALDMAVYEDVYALIVIIAVLGVLLDFVFNRIRLRVTHWSDTLNEQPASKG